jgi:hypothetical protein
MTPAEVLASLKDASDVAVDAMLLALALEGGLDARNREGRHIGFKSGDRLVVNEVAPGSVTIYPAQGTRFFEFPLPYTAQFETAMGLAKLFLPEASLDVSFDPKGFVQAVVMGKDGRLIGSGLSHHAPTAVLWGVLVALQNLEKDVVPIKVNRLVALYMLRVVNEHLASALATVYDTLIKDPHPTHDWAHLDRLVGDDFLSRQVRHLGEQIGKVLVFTKSVRQTVRGLPLVDREDLNQMIVNIRYLAGAVEEGKPGPNPTRMRDWAAMIERLYVEINLLTEDVQVEDRKVLDRLVMDGRIRALDEAAALVDSKIGEMKKPGCLIELSAAIRALKSR